MKFPASSLACCVPNSNDKTVSVHNNSIITFHIHHCGKNVPRLKAVYFPLKLAHQTITTAIIIGAQKRPQNIIQIFHFNNKFACYYSVQLLNLPICCRQRHRRTNKAYEKREAQESPLNVRRTVATGPSILLFGVIVNYETGMLRIEIFFSWLGLPCSGLFCFVAVV